MLNMKDRLIRFSPVVKNHLNISLFYMLLYYPEQGHRMPFERQQLRVTHLFRLRSSWKPRAILLPVR